MPSEAIRPAGLGRAFGYGRPALVAYLMAGYPDRESSLDAIRIVAQAGADLVELGVPYADPLADGPVIREAAETARRTLGGFGLAETIELAGEFIAGGRVAGGDVARGATPPIALMTYLNPLMRMGLSRAADALRNAGVEGVIVPDMPLEAASPWLAVSAGVDTVMLAAPTSTPERLAALGAASSGFVYCVSTTGVTGEREALPEDLSALVGRVRAATSLPVAVGFGVSTPEQAARVAQTADGVVVGSAIVRRQHDPAELAEYVSAVADAVHVARS